MTLYIAGMCTGIHSVDDAISKLSSLEELHLVDCKVHLVSSGLLRLSQLRAQQITNSRFDGQKELVLPDLSVLPKLTKLAIQCGLDVFPGQLCNCTHLTSFSFQGQSDCELPVGPYLRNLNEIAVSVVIIRNVVEEVTNLQRLYCLGSSSAKAVLSKLQTDADLRMFALSVPNLQEMILPWNLIRVPHALQKCIFLNKLLTESSRMAQPIAVMQVRSVEDGNVVLPWTLKVLW